MHTIQQGNGCYVTIISNYSSRQRAQFLRAQNTHRAAMIDFWQARSSPASSACRCCCRLILFRKIQARPWSCRTLVVTLQIMTFMIYRNLDNYGFRTVDFDSIWTQQSHLPKPAKGYTYSILMKMVQFNNSIGILN